MFKFIKNNSYDIFKMFLNQIGIAMLALVMTMATHQNDQLYLITSIFCIVFYIYLLYTMTYEIGQKDKPKLDGGRMEINPLKGFWLSLCANSVNILCGIMIAVFSLFIVMQSPVTISDANGNPVTAYVRNENPASSETSQEGSSDVSSDTVSQPKEYEYYEVSLFSDKGGSASTYQYENSKESEIIDENQRVTYLYDKDGNELELYTDTGMKLSTKQRSVENWASNFYGIPYIIATFFQSMYAGVRSQLFGNTDIFYLFSTIPSLIFCTLAYYMGAKGKRILFFLPERKSRRRR